RRLQDPVLMHAPFSLNFLFLNEMATSLSGSARGRASGGHGLSRSMPVQVWSRLVQARSRWGCVTIPGKTPGIVSLVQVVQVTCNSLLYILFHVLYSLSSFRLLMDFKLPGPPGPLSRFPVISSVCSRSYLDRCLDQTWTNLDRYGSRSTPWLAGP